MQKNQLNVGLPNSESMVEVGFILTCDLRTVWSNNIFRPHSSLGSYIEVYLMMCICCHFVLLCFVAQLHKTQAAMKPVALKCAEISLYLSSEYCGI